MAHVAVVVLFVAGAAKLLDVSAFEGVLKTWSLVPEIAIPVLAVVVPSVELALSVWWFAGVGRRWAGLLVVVLLLAFTVAYGVQATWADAPECGCFGAIAVFKSGQRQAVVLVLRNGLLILAVGTGMALGASEARTLESEG
jgi:hypothetical protein